MDSVRLLQKLFAYGADRHGIQDRFNGDAELYRLHFVEFLVEPNLERLDQALAQGNMDEAFDAAHALKDLSGNLGLTPTIRPCVSWWRPCAGGTPPDRTRCTPRCGGPDPACRPCSSVWNIITKIGSTSKAPSI